ncbi:MAG: iron ABC transporter permease [Pseudomonadales bacterium]|nr:iron ABC transporter permease [Pseudomonadales bacterium]MCP5215593.1 iron ABC transporter permease [Pseudomonadales bacterium]
MTKSTRLLVLLFCAALTSLIVSVSSGSMTLTFGQLWQALTTGSESLAHTLIWELRIPRAITAFMVGAMLSIAGALMQVILRNPLADPYILGVSGGASVAALLAMLAGIASIGVSLSAFFGALLSTLLVFGIAHGTGSWSPMKVLLTGVVLASGWGALISLILAISPDQGLRSMLYWLMGDFGYSSSYGWASLALLIGIASSYYLARPLNLLLHGSVQAASLGVSVEKVYLIIFIIASFLTAVSVSMAGNIGFVGLIVPHLVRLSIGSDHRTLLPASLLLGGTLMVIADLLARTLFSPQQLPVGVITALLGVPLFLFILYRGQRKF